VGVLEEAKGKAKEAVGGVSGSNDLRDEGQAQQRKAGEEDKAEQARLEAEKHESKAEGHEGAERRHQGT
jgi:uncharacterized protein YjbJ (UPF0337 family)